MCLPAQHATAKDVVARVRNINTSRASARLPSDQRILSHAAG
jgi:hypothetical protein